MTTTTFPRVSVLGSSVDLISTTTAVDLMESWIADRSGGCRQIVVTGFHGIWTAHQNAQFKTVLNSADAWVPDGIAPVLVARLRGHRGVRRVPGAELMEAFFHRANHAGYRSFFYGDTDATLTALRETLGRRFPEHQVAGTISPPFRPLSPEEEHEYIDTINAAQPDVVWVGLGLPRQEQWIHRHRARLHAPVAVGVGAAFAFAAGTVRRAPEWVGRLGFEWAYRLLQEPRKCWRRCFVEGPQFLGHVGLELTGLRRYDQKH
jgi:N-acetylglucosaminyldiphosphoundecaprenol N-acetyl-beta-D-mannosaminyltransferase